MHKINHLDLRQNNGSKNNSRGKYNTNKQIKIKLQYKSQDFVILVMHTYLRMAKLQKQTQVVLITVKK